MRETVFADSGSWTGGGRAYGVHTFYLLIGTCESVDSSIL
jgi:hypothetical protein